MQAQELMRAHTVTTTPDATLSQAADLMDLYQVRALAVVDAKGRLCGILTERDILRAFGSVIPDAEVGPSGKSLDNWRRAAPRVASLPVAEWMIQTVDSALESADASDVAETIIRDDRASVPVVSADETVVGVVTRIELLLALFEDKL